MKLNRRGMVLGVATLGVTAAVATGIGVAHAETTPSPTTSPSAATPWHGHGGGRGGMMGGQGSALTAAASYLGLSQTDLLAKLQAGTSLADLAEAKGKSVSGLADAMIAARKSALDADTTLTAEQKALCLAQMKSRITTMIDQVHAPGMGHGHRM
jgi:hypothetical protein